MFFFNAMCTSVRLIYIYNACMFNGDLKAVRTIYMQNVNPHVLLLLTEECKLCAELKAEMH